MEQEYFMNEAVCCITSGGKQCWAVALPAASIAEMTDTRVTSVPLCFSLLAASRLGGGGRGGPSAAPPPSTFHPVLWHPLMTFAQINIKSRVAKRCFTLFCSLLVSIILPTFISWHTSVRKSCPSPLRPDPWSVTWTRGHSGKVIDASSFPCNLPVVSN